MITILALSNAINASKVRPHENPLPGGYRVYTSTPREFFADLTNTDRFCRLTTAELVHFCEAKYAPSVVKVYYYIKSVDPDSAVKTPQWYDRIEFRLNAMNIKLADVLHALKKYSVQAIEDAIAYTQKQTWSKAKAGVFVNYLKKWTPMTGTVKSKSKAVSEPVKTALMQRFPDIATTLSQERNPIDEATLDYLQELKVAGGIYDMQYSSIHNSFGVFITIKDYPHPITWWDAVPQLQELYPNLDAGLCSGDRSI